MSSALKVYRHGVSGGVVSCGNSEPPKRGVCGGWSIRSSRSNTRFLWSVRQEELTGVGVSFSLTVRECPPSHAEWKRVREALIVRMRRRGLIRLHWLTEMQKRGVPHMHGMAFFDLDTAKVPAAFADQAAEYLRIMIVADWLALTAQWGSGRRAQDAKLVYDLVGWAQYLAKHAARGATHYQRCAETLPAGWHGVTGRMWGYVGDWPVDEPLGLDLDFPGWFAFRRLLRSYRISKARALPPGKCSYAIRGARRCLVCTNPKAAPYRGVSGWIPQAVVLAMMAHLETRGFVIQST